MTTPLFRDYVLMPKEALGRLNRPALELEAEVEAVIEAAYASREKGFGSVNMHSALARLDALMETKG